MKTQKKLRTGVIGLGMGYGHATEYRNHPRCELVAVADADPARYERVKDSLGAPTFFADAMEMIRTVPLDIISIATPNKFHKEYAIAAFKAGSHVLCEKPMAMNAKEGAEILAASKKARRRLMINFSYRFTPQAQALKREVDAGVLGEVYFGRTVWHRRRGMPGFGGWFGQKELAGGGPLIDLGVHRIDLALWLMGYPKPVWAMGSTYNKIAGPLAKASGKKFDVEDMAVGLIKFANGATLEVESSWAANIKENELMETRLLGTQGGLVHKNVGGGYDFEAELFMERNGSQYDMALHPPVPGTCSSNHHFVNAILDGTPHIATGEEGLTVMKLLDAIYASAARGTPVRIR